ncbi:MAG: cob(I)yrinic acid a,c-diamide adenosyltransferase [Bacteroidaceae bacterium]|nr:cob(I)yrinic acid a,c-diamide adenosyltransferase [Bacteroidaceae bacterium]MBP5647620.1 cob(I)yrinic acid a,c-diamide adenosyltransferase [Bacteroidaceae bacterium]
MSKIYTRTGDKGTTSLVGGKRVSKTDPRLDAYGTIDELNSFIGLMLSVMDGKAESTGNIRWIQQKLFNIGGCLATDTTSFQLPDSCRILAADVERIENMIDALTDGLPEQRSFILPGGTEASSYAHVARTVCRRAERLILALPDEAKVPSELLMYINRLSDYLFVLARRINFFAGVSENIW